jgi:hypothetical protein
MRDVVTVVSCNSCTNPIDVEEPDGAEWSLSFAGPEGVLLQGRVDLCSGCAGDWVEDVRILLAEALPYKRPKPVVTGTGAVHQPEPEEHGVICPEPSCRRWFGKQAGLSRHRTASGH